MNAAVVERILQELEREGELVPDPRTELGWVSTDGEDVLDKMRHRLDRIMATEVHPRVRGRWEKRVRGAAFKEAVDSLLDDLLRRGEVVRDEEGGPWASSDAEPIGAKLTRGLIAAGVFRPDLPPDFRAHWKNVRTFRC